jgi:Fe-Mn family superoxide dismutase
MIGGKTMTYTTPELPYAYDALEPYFDEQTMRIHHDKHHETYTMKFNKALEGHPDLAKKTAEELLKDLQKIPENIRTAVINNGGGHVNHNFFWTILHKTRAQGEIITAIEKTFGSMEAFKEQFSTAAINHFGSGWAWLVLNKGKLEIMTTANQDSPLSQGKKPILTLDLWEHSYYLRYQNKRPAYTEAFFSVINWEKVNEYYLLANKK